jgi:hypothetical protein
MTHYWILLTSSEDSRIWTFSLTASAGLVGLIVGAVSAYLGTRQRGTSKKQDTD